MLLLSAPPLPSDAPPHPSEAGLGFGDVDLYAVGALRGRVLSGGCGALGRQQPLPGLLPLLVHGRVHAAVFPRRQLRLQGFLWHGGCEGLLLLLGIDTG